jgi:hypothetical protein
VLTAILWLSAGQAGAQPVLPGQTGPPPLPPPPPPVPAPSEPAPVFDEPCAPPEHKAGWLNGTNGLADYLYLKPRAQPLDYVIVNPSATDAPLGPVRSLNYDWHSGFRVGLGNASINGWDIGVFYTYLHSSTNDNTNAPDNGVLLATLTHPGVVSLVQTAQADANFNYNVFDLEVARIYHPGDTVCVRLFGGARFAHIDRGVNALYNGGDANDDLVSSRLKLDAGGLRAGGRSDWELAHGLCLYGRGDVSLLIGNFNTGLTETNNAGASVLTNVSYPFEKVVPVLELEFGVSWRYQNLRLSAGYQFINWFGAIDVPDFADDGHQGKLIRRTADLSLDGLAVHAELTY